MKLINDKELEAVDISDLREKMAALAEELAKREKQEKLDRAKAVEKAAFEYGFSSINEAARVLAGRYSAPGDAVTYCNPENPEETWAGRGRKPEWLRNYQLAGGDLNDLPTTKAKPRKKDRR